MPNPWDGASALLLKREGFLALGSTSIGIAFAMGRHDGRHAVSRADAIANAALLTRLTGLPVNGDLEDGFGPSPQDCVDTVNAAVEAGLGGLGIEDTTANPTAPIHAFDDAVERIRAAAKAARGRIVLTGRTDIYTKGKHDLDEAICRLVAFAEAGADVLYVPGLADVESIAKVVKAVAPKPLNAVMGSRPFTLEQLAAAGVRRISLGGSLYRCAMGALVETARALRAGDFAAAARGIPSRDIMELLPEA